MAPKTFRVVPLNGPSKSIEIDDSATVYDLAVAISNAFGVILENIDIRTRNGRQFLSKVQEEQIKNVEELQRRDDILMVVRPQTKTFLPKEPNIPCGGRRRGRATKKTRRSKKSRRQTRRRR